MKLRKIQNKTINKEKNTSFEEMFNDVSSDVDNIFKSYQKLYDIYSESFSNIKNNIGNLPQNFQNEVVKAVQMFDLCNNTVKREQCKISEKLYEQGLILLIGSSESLLREAFRNLLKKNLGIASIKNNVIFTFEEIMNNNDYDKFSKLVLEKLENDKNPSEKLNFQNVQQMKGIFSGYLHINFDNKILFKELHKYWQIRHLVIHNRGIIDERFLDNLNAAKIDTSIFKLGKGVCISSDDYDSCKKIIKDLFKNLDFQIKQKNLKL